MGSLGVNRRYASASIFLLMGIWCWVAFDRPYNFPSHIAWNIYSNSPQTSPVLDVFKTPPLYSPPLKALCDRTIWNDNVTFVCDESFGGVVEVRNSILSCVRFAIAAGGALVLPKIVVREETSGDPISRNATGIEYMFDRQHFLHSLKWSCPQMTVYETVRHIPDPQNALGPVSLLPEDLVRANPAAGPEEWRELFYHSLSHQFPYGDASPVIIELQRSFLQYPIFSDGEAFADLFGKLLSIRADIRRLATRVLMELSDTYSLELDMSSSILRHAYMGAYISTKPVSERDNIEMDRVTSLYDSQSRLYISQARLANMSIIYAASDDEYNLSNFVREGSLHGLAVSSKFSLLEGRRENGMLLGLTPDQQDIVDFLVLLKSSGYAGVGHSALTWNIALERHRHAAMKRALDGPLAMNDELSRIYGPVGGNPQFATCMWP